MLGANLLVGIGHILRCGNKTSQSRATIRRARALPGTRVQFSASACSMLNEVILFYFSVLANQTQDFMHAGKVLYQ